MSQQAPAHIFQIIDEAIAQHKQMDEIISLLTERGIEPQKAEAIILSRIQAKAEAQAHQPRAKHSQSEQDDAYISTCKKQSSRWKVMLLGFSVLVTVLVWWTTEDNIASIFVVRLGLITVGILNLFTDFRGGWWD